MKQLFFFVLATFLVTACGTSKLERPMARNLSYESDTGERMANEDVLKNRLIIYTARLNLQVKNIEEKKLLIESLLTQYQSYLQSGSEYSWTIRVPQKNYEALLTELEQLGDITSKNEYTQDVTDQYRDTEIRLETLEKSRQRYLELLDKAEKVSEILEIERELERVNVSIESLKGSLKRFDSQIQYATITLNLQEKVKPGPLGYVGIGIYKVVKWLFVWN